MRPPLWGELFAGGLLCLALGGCQGRETALLPPTTTFATVGATAGHTPTVADKGISTPARTGTATRTPLPPDTCQLPSQEWPPAGTLLLPFEGEVTFETSPDSLPAGDYLVYLDRQNNVVGYSALDGRVKGVLVRMGEGLDLPELFLHDSHRFVMGNLALESTFYDLQKGRAWRVGPICLWRSAIRASPDGAWIAAECEGVEMEGVGEAHTVMEILSTEEGRGFRVAIPREPEDDPDRPPYVFWLDATTLLVWDAWIEEDFATCGLTFPGSTLYCPDVFRGQNAPSIGSTDPESEFVALLYSKEYPWRSILVPRDCLSIGGECSGIIDLGETGTVPVVTRNPGLVWWITPLEPTELSRIGAYEAPAWESRDIAEYGGSYWIMADCPDGRCLFLEKLDSTLRYRLDLDGTLTVVSYQEIIGTFSIP